MATETDNDPVIPTLTDVVKQGNPSLMFNLRPPPSPVTDDDPVEEEKDRTASGPEDIMELEVYEREVQEEMFQITGHPDNSDLILPGETDNTQETEAEAQGSAVLVNSEDTRPEQTGGETEPEQPKSSFSLEALGLPFDFFSKAGKESEEEVEHINLDEPEVSEEHEATQAVETPPEPPAEKDTEQLPDLDVESVLMALEAPISDILQRHMESAREEIHGLIREQLERHQQN